MNDKQWAEHILERFGRRVSLAFICGDGNCPCQYSNRSCVSCEYSCDELPDLNCIESGKFITMKFKRFHVMKIKRHLIKMVD